MYMPMLASSNTDANFVVRGALSPEGLAARLRDAVHAADPHQLVYQGRMMEDVISDSVSPQRTNTLLLSVFGAIAIALAAIGVYSVLAYGVSRRVREFGVRAALGAERRDVLRLVMREGILLASIGAAIGIAVAVALSNLIASLLYQVSPHDPRIFVLAPLALMAIAFAATLVPALRATRVDPMEALRAE
jgi:ABC-type antimicrobial peptide transport system permease subunit